jgi:hypothetical protein
MTAYPLQDGRLTDRAEPATEIRDRASQSGTGSSEPIPATGQAHDRTDSSGAVKIWEILKEAWMAPVSLKTASTIYCAIDLDGRVHIYEMTDARLMKKIEVETQAAFLPVPETIDQVHEYLRSTTYQLEIFEDWTQLETWAASYAGFRAGELRAELRRYQMRRASYDATTSITSGRDRQP